MKTLTSIAALAVLVVNTQAALGQDILIRGARVHTLTPRGTLERTDVLIRDGRIVAVGSELKAGPHAEVIEAGNRPLTPGFFAGLSTLGLAEVPAESSSVDGILNLGAPPWQQQWRPEFDVSLAYNPHSTVVPVTRIEGLTWTVVVPSSNHILAGQGAAVTLDGRYDAVLGGSRSLFIEMGGRAGDKSGGSRAAQYMLLEQAISEVRGPPVPMAHTLLLPAGREALKPYLAGGRVIFHVDRAADIHQVMAFAVRHGMKPVIAGGSEAWEVADELARAHVPVILNTLENLPRSFDSLGARLDNAAILRRAGVTVAFSSGEDHNARKVRQLAGNAVARGLSWNDALAAVTAAPADIFGLGAVRGRIAVGQVADLVLWSDDPLEMTSMAEQVWIAGEPVRMWSRQIELRDRYFEGLKAEDPTGSGSR